MKKVIDTEYRKYSLSNVEADVHWLHKSIEKDGFRPDIIIGVCRGGWIPARLLCDKFAHFEEVKKEDGTSGVHVRYPHLFNIGMRRYSTVKGGSEITWYQELGENAKKEIKGKKVLIVDDIIDGGASILAVAKRVKEAEPSKLGVVVLGIKENPYVVLKESMSEEEKKREIAEATKERNEIMQELEKVTVGNIFIKDHIQGDNVWALYPWENQEIRLEIYRRYGKEAFEQTLPVESLTSSMMADSMYKELPNFEKLDEYVKRKNKEK